MKTKVKPTGRERTFSRDEIIVSKTDKQGRITYTNSVFRRMANMTNKELINSPQSIIRHPDMPGGLFLYLWNNILNDKEVFAYINNLAADGANYWVLAHITPSRDKEGNIIGFHSNRRSPSRNAVSEIIPVYKEMRRAELTIANKKQAATTSLELLQNKLQEANTTYPEYVWKLISKHEL